MNNKKTGPVGIDLSSDRLLSIAADCLDDHDYIGALKMLNKNAVTNGNDADSYMLYAETFDDMRLYEKCKTYWFRYLDYAGEDADFEEAYEGLAVSYMNCNEESMAAFYYNRLLEYSDASLSDEARNAIVSEFLSKKKSPLKFAYPPSIADYSEEIEKGVAAMRSDDLKGAIESFSEISEGSESYVSARNYIAMCYVMEDKSDEAEKECNDILSRRPQDVQTLALLSSIKVGQGKKEEAREIAERLYKLGSEKPDDLYKIATVCSENGMHEEAYEIFGKLAEAFPYDCSVLYFRAISAFNSGKDKACLEIFDTLLTIYPNAFTADYWRSEAKRMIDNKRCKRKELSYLYRMPKKERTNRLVFLSAFMKAGKKERALLTENSFLTSCVLWCFDEGAADVKIELQLVGAAVSVEAHMYDLTRDILLEPTGEDYMKMETVARLVSGGAEGDFGLVICNEYKRLKLIPLVVGSAKRALFAEAYGLVISRLAMFGVDYVERFNRSASELYSKLKENDRLRNINDCGALAAAIYRFSGIGRSDLGGDDLYTMFFTTKKKVDKILEE